MATVPALPAAADARKYVRRRVLAGERDRARLARGLRAQARQAVARTVGGLGD